MSRQRNPSRIGKFFSAIEDSLLGDLIGAMSLFATAYLLLFFAGVSQ